MGNPKDPLVKQCPPYTFVELPFAKDVIKRQAGDEKGRPVNIATFLRVKNPDYDPMAPEPKAKKEDDEHTRLAIEEKAVLLQKDIDHLWSPGDTVPSDWRWPIHGDPEIGHARSPAPTARKAFTDEQLTKIEEWANTKFNVCTTPGGTTGLVQRFGIFWWWSDHAHNHARDVAARSFKWLRYFVAPYAAESGVYPMGKKDENIPFDRSWLYWKGMARVSGLLHDVGMAANPSYEKELAEAEASILTPFKTDPNFDAVAAAEKFMKERMLKPKRPLSTEEKEKVEKAVKRLLGEKFGEFLGTVAEAPADKAKAAEVAYVARYVKEQIAFGHKLSVRVRHGLSSTFYLLSLHNDPKDTSAVKKLLTRQDMEKVALIVSMHSKSFWPYIERKWLTGHATGIDASTKAPTGWNPGWPSGVLEPKNLESIDAGTEAYKNTLAPYNKIQHNYATLPGTFVTRDPAANPPPNWGAWLNKGDDSDPKKAGTEYQVLVAASIAGARQASKNKARQLVSAYVDERKYIVALAKCVALADACRWRGIGKLLDHEKQPLGYVPVDAEDQKKATRPVKLDVAAVDPATLQDTPADLKKWDENTPFRSMFAIKMKGAGPVHDPDKSKAADLQESFKGVVQSRWIDEAGPRPGEWKDVTGLSLFKYMWVKLFGARGTKAQEVLAYTRFHQIKKDQLKAVLEHPDNDLLAPIGNQVWHIGELTTLFDLGDSGDFGLKKGKVCIKITIDTDVSWGEAAAMATYILPEMPRSCGKQWTVAIEHSAGSRITAHDWYTYGKDAASPYRHIWDDKKTPRPPWMSWYRGKDMLGLSLDDGSYPFDQLAAGIRKYSEDADTKATFFIKTRTAWEEVDGK